ncbi:MAG: prepilin-type N-terminal cleavage/methylation domain-containing protein [Bifidobacteriaceae bacterium]|jgi:hypothetical protein|nr:prepilin-type N-terminal cleavage/methylation domain-containing protein [Bifidobacteriaceae bacterium]
MMCRRPRQRLNQRLACTQPDDERNSESGATLVELLVVMAITSAIFILLATVTTSLVKHNAVNLIRQQTVDSMRETSVWLSEALSHAASDPEDATGRVFSVAQPEKVVFTAALEDTSPDRRVVSKVTLVVGEACWTGQEAEADILRRCVQRPLVDVDGTAVWCDKGTASCPEELFDEKILARGVKNKAIFAYALELNPGADGMLESIPATYLTQIAAVEVNMTLTGKKGSPGEKVESNLIKRHNVKGWRKL